MASRCQIWAHALSETGSKGHGFASMHVNDPSDKLPIILYYYLWGVKFDTRVDFATQDPDFDHFSDRFWSEKMSWADQIRGPTLSVTTVLLVWVWIWTGLIFWPKLAKKLSQKLSENDQHIRFLVTSWSPFLDFVENCRFWAKFGCKWTLLGPEIGSKIGWVATTFWPESESHKRPLLPIWLRYPYEMVKTLTTRLLESRILVNFCPKSCNNPSNFGTKSGTGRSPFPSKSRKAVIFWSKTCNNPSNFGLKSGSGLSPFPSKSDMPQHVCSKVVPGDNLDLNLSIKGNNII